MHGFASRLLAHTVLAPCVTPTVYKVSSPVLGNPYIYNIPRWNLGRTKNQFQDQDLVQDLAQDQDLAQEVSFRKIMKCGLKCIHMAQYELILKQDGAIWLRIIFKRLLTSKKDVGVQKLPKHPEMDPQIQKIHIIL